MPSPVTMPRLGLSMAEGTVVAWRVAPGERVVRGQPLLDVESEKAEVEVEAFASGVLAAVYVEAGATVPVGTLLAAIAEPDEPFDAAAFAARFLPETGGAPPAARPPASAPAAAALPAPAGVRAAPAARAAARRLGVDLALVAGTGPGGRITVEDVEAAAAAPLARVNGTGLAWARAGAGPPLLLVNGFGVDASAWRRQADALAARHTVLTYEHRGIGRSWPVGEGPLALATLAADAAALLGHLGLAPAVAVGASLGAAVALELALAHPEAVRGLVLLTPVVTPDARLEAVLRSWLDHEAPASEARIRAMLPWLLGREHLAHAGRRAAAAAAFRAMAARTPAVALARHAEALLAWLGTRTAALGRLAVPTLVLAGDDDVLAARAHAEAVAAGIPGARLCVLAGAGHALAVERAEAVSEAIAALAAEAASR